MHIKRLDHVNLRTTRLEEMIGWYVDVLGLSNGERPDFGFPGAWLYAGDHAIVHLVDVDPPESTGAEVDLKLEHFAMIASGAAEFEARLNDLGQKFQKMAVEGTGLVAFNVWDPDGNHIHVDFALTE